MGLPEFFSRHQQRVTPILTWFHYLLWVLLPLGYFLPLFRVGLQDEEGLFALQSERLLQGLLPNVDYICAYLGGTVFYNALWLKVLGTSVFSIRVGLLCLIVLFLLSVFHLAKKLMNPFWAHLTTLFVLATTLSLYPAVGANWYALFFSFFAFLVWTRPLSDGSIRHRWGWFLGAGVLVGISFLMKQTVGLYSAFSFFLILMLAHLQHPTHTHPSPSRMHRLGQLYAYSLLVLIPLSAFLIFSKSMSLHLFLIYLLPVLMIIYMIFRQMTRTSFRFSQFAKDIQVFMLGGAFTVFLYLIPFLLQGEALHFLENSLIRVPSVLLDIFFQDYMLSLGKNSAVFIGLTVAGCLLWLKNIRWAACLVLLIWCYLLLQIQDYHQWNFVSWLILLQLPIWIMFGTLLLIWPQLKDRQSTRHPWLAVYLLIYGILCFWNTYPVFATPYFATNFAPLAILLVYLCFVFAQHGQTVGKFGVALILSNWLALGILNAYSFTSDHWQQWVQNPLHAYQYQLPIQREQIIVTKNQYEQLAQPLIFIQQFSKRADDLYILADSYAELYYFTQHINPTKYDYHYLSRGTDGSDIIQALEKHQVRYILAQTHKPFFSPIQQSIQEYLQKHYQAIAQFQELLVLERTPSTHPE